MFSNNHVIKTCWLKWVRNFTSLKHSVFWKDTVTFNLKKFCSNSTFRWYTFGRFYIKKFDYFSGKPKRWKRGFEILLTDHYVGKKWNKNIAGTYQKLLASVSPTLYYVSQFRQLVISIMFYMYYLSTCNRGICKSYDCYDMILLWKNDQIFPSRHFQYNHRLFLISRKMRNIRSCKLVSLEKLIEFRFSGWYSLWYSSSCLNIIIIWGELLLPILCKMFWKKLQMLFFSKPLNFFQELL